MGRTYDPLLGKVREGMTPNKYLAALRRLHSLPKQGKQVESVVKRGQPKRRGGK